MKTIAVIGCSNSTGEEIRDWELDPNYYNEESRFSHANWYAHRRKEEITKYFDKYPEKILTSDPNGYLNENQWELFKEHLIESTGTLDQLKDMSWNVYNDTFAWPALLDKHEEYKVHSFATRGAGLSHFENVYNAERSVKQYDWKKRHISHAMYKPVEKYERDGNCLTDNGMMRYYNNNHNFKDVLDNADLLIWQFTGEPRYSINHVIDSEATKHNMDLTRMFTYAANLEGVLGWLPNYLEGDALKTYQDWFTYYYDLASNFTRSLTWIEQLMEIRELKGKKNMIFPIHMVFTSRFGYKAIRTENTKSYGFDDYVSLDSGSCPGILRDEMALKEEEIDYHTNPGPQQYTCKYSHPSEKGHIAIADWVHKTIKEDL
jgi:hypothetical protein